MIEERKPLLTDADIRRYGYDEMDVREIYENLITTGKLRVVEEVEGIIRPFTNAAGVVHASVVCPSCESNIAPYGIGNPNNYFNYCPGCGNKIKR